VVKPAAKRGGAREGWAAGACVGIDLGTTNSAVAQQGHEAPAAPLPPPAAPVAPHQPLWHHGSPLWQRGPSCPFWPRVESPHAASML